MTLLCLREGPLVRFIDGTMHVDELNPEVSARWRMSRWEMLAFAARTLWAALRYSTSRR